MKKVWIDPQNIILFSNFLSKNPESSMMEGLVASRMDDLEGSRMEDLEVVSCRLDLDVSYRLDLAQ